MFRIDLHPVDHCNLACIGCNHASPYLKKRVYEGSEYSRWLKKLDEKGVRWNATCLSGGEPTLHPDLPSFIDEVKGYGSSSMEMVTNLRWLKDEESIDKMDSILSRLDWLIVSKYKIVAEKIGEENMNNLLDKISQRYNYSIIDFNQGRVNEKFAIIPFTEEPLPIKSLDCCVQNCTQLFVEGKMGRCTYTRGVGTPATSQGFDEAIEWFNLRKDFTQDDVEKWATKYPLEACRYCGIAQGTGYAIDWVSDPKIRNDKR